MKRTMGICALLVLAAMTPACGVDILEDVGTDPHPPTAVITELIKYVAPAAELPPEPPPAPATPGSSAAFPQARSTAWYSGGFTLATGELFQIGIAYTDAGGDILKFQLRDRDGAFRLDLTPTDSTYFSGTSGTLLGPEAGAEITGIYGRHRLELWAEDSHLSRSEKVEFTITLIP